MEVVTVISNESFDLTNIASVLYYTLTFLQLWTVEQIHQSYSIIKITLEWQIHFS